MIKQVPVSRRSVKDRWCWVDEISGVYSVKSGYKRLTTAVPLPPPPLNWNSVWRLTTPPKVKDKVWRALSDCLPTTKALISRFVPIDGGCPWCSAVIEDVFHALVGCSKARQVWLFSNIGDLSFQFSNFASFWSHICKHYSQHDVELAAMICWVLWVDINNWVWNKCFVAAPILFNNGSTFLASWKQAKLLNNFMPTQSSTTPSSWHPPPPQRLKVNFDAAVFNDSNLLDFGAIARNSDTGFVACCNDTLNGPSDALFAEAYAFRETLKWVIDNHWSNVLFESDSQLLVQLCA
ncbi:hypothetical protein M5689_019472 [Euphorbia peplus]|nr:hypothetical protein M5689_019472 [Euphorbia peplus]